MLDPEPHISNLKVDSNLTVYFGSISEQLAQRVIDYWNSHDRKRSSYLLNYLPGPYTIEEALKRRYGMP